MKTKSTLANKVIVYFLLLLCIMCISIYTVIYGVPSVHSVHESFAVSANNEDSNSGDGNNNSFIHRAVDAPLNHIFQNNISNSPFLVMDIIASTILFIQISESYFYGQINLLSNLKKSLIAKKIRLND